MFEWLHVLTAFLRHKSALSMEIHNLEAIPIKNDVKGYWTYIALVCFTNYLSRAPWRYHEYSMNTPLICQRASAPHEPILACKNARQQCLGLQRLSGSMASTLMRRAAAICTSITQALGTTSVKKYIVGMF